MPKHKIVHASLAAAILLSMLNVPAANASPEFPSPAIFIATEKPQSVAYASSAALPLADKWVLPLKSKTFRATSSKGPRCIPVRGGSTEHLGQDFGTANGSPIYAAAAGKVLKTRQGTASASGYILIQHNVNGSIYTGAYYHMWSATTHVKVGSIVKAGQQIANVGNSGPSTAPHLHFELWKGGWYEGTAVDPVPFLKARGLDLYAHATTVYPDVRPTSCTYWLAENTALRETASTSGALIKNLSKGTRVAAKPAAGANKHLHVTADGVTGWLQQSMITPNFVAAPIPPKVTVVNSYKGSTYKTTAPLILRTSARDGAAIRTLAHGAQVTATGQTALSESWLQIKAAGTTGWVFKAYLAKTAAPKPVAPPTAEVNPQGTVKPQTPKPAAPKPPVSKPAPPHVVAVKYTVKDNLNLRAIPKTGKVLGVMKKGSALTATGKSAHSGTWLEVKFGSKTGWAAAKYLTKQKPVALNAKPKPKGQPTPKAAVDKPATRYTTSGLNMRAGAGTSHKVVQVLKAKTKVQLTGKKSGKWVQVKVGTKTGWVSGSYLK